MFEYIFFNSLELCFCFFYKSFPMFGVIYCIFLNVGFYNCQSLLNIQLTTGDMNCVNWFIGLITGLLFRLTQKISHYFKWLSL